ncbi:MAG TPA: class I SAM-dependent methyltransferase [Spirochaetia bacterium]|nr:class I SAM-dependent methyltransferase [Spirochaetia bacterium]
MIQRDDIIDARRFYDDMESDYDLMVSWKTRLEREAAFLRRTREEIGATSALDAACGTGMHAIVLARQGLRCAGADLSPRMIARARQNADDAGVEVDFRVAAFGELAQTFRGTFDLVTCLGNSLPHLLDDDSLLRALEDFSRVLSPAGLLLIQNRNYDRVIREKMRFMPLTARTDGSEESLFLRITDLRGDVTDLADFTIVTLRKKDGAWSQSVRTTTLRALRRRTLEDALGASGFSRVRAWGGYDFSQFDEAVSADLLIAATRA